jgi:hypothetical protein
VVIIRGQHARDIDSKNRTPGQHGATQRKSPGALGIRAFRNHSRLDLNGADLPRGAREFREHCTYGVVRGWYNNRHEESEFRAAIRMFNRLMHSRPHYRKKPYAKAESDDWCGTAIRQMTFTDGVR